MIAYSKVKGFVFCHRLYLRFRMILRANSDYFLKQIRLGNGCREFIKAVWPSTLLTFLTKQVKPPDLEALKSV